MDIYLCRNEVFDVDFNLCRYVVFFIWIFTFVEMARLVTGTVHCFLKVGDALRFIFLL